ncbi:tyrosine-type recombinase/integrase [Microbacterium trichothecenolyticum]|uniref:tyrosine-type recombinase/integrase n=1 Tax=Microbacterium trichothecenolyticum TaxID=69370 RepID=UPI001C6DDDE1|nr:tyrosine-type recombinase/integrase [Microbacterium trichothecenolyticum]MBW9118900.1 tyrosine-type recombinase/integrase [Microbacterium trichothecenolyticum]
MSDVTAPLPASRDAELARRSFLAHYTGETLKLYTADLRLFFTWCADIGIHPLDARRSTLEAFVRHLEHDRHNSGRSIARRFQTLRSFYKLAVADEIIDRDPTPMVRLPKWSIDRTTIAWLDDREMGRLLRQAEDTSPHYHALVALMAMLGLRVSEACSIDIDDFTEDAIGYTLVTVTRKGGKVRTMPVPVPLLRILERARDGRTTGPLILTKRRNRQTRNGAYFWIKELCRKAGLPENVHPHSLRHSYATALVRAGMSIQDTQASMDHADVRTTMHYYHQPMNHDRHGAHVAARVFASAA